METGHDLLYWFNRVYDTTWWAEGQVAMYSDVQIVHKTMFRAVRGTMADTDFVALDELEVRHTAECNTIPTSAIPVPDPCKMATQTTISIMIRNEVLLLTGWGCDFQDENLCGWAVKATNEQFTLRRINGVQAEAEGSRLPRKDWANSTEAHYLGVQSHAPAGSGGYASTNTHSGDIDVRQYPYTCFNFWYSHAESTKLKAVIETRTGADRYDTVWAMVNPVRGGAAALWEQAQVMLRSLDGHNYQVCSSRT